MYSLFQQNQLLVDLQPEVEVQTHDQVQPLVEMEVEPEELVDLQPQVDLEVDLEMQQLVEVLQDYKLFAKNHELQPKQPLQPQKLEEAEAMAQAHTYPHPHPEPQAEAMAQKQPHSEPQPHKQPN
jgi:hypothetical protein